MSPSGSRKDPLLAHKGLVALVKRRFRQSKDLSALTSSYSLGVLPKKSNADSKTCAGQNTAIAKLAGEILGGVEGVYRLDVGGNGKF